MVFHVVIEWLSLGHFNVFVPFMMGIDGVEFGLGKVVDNASTKRIPHYIDWRSHPVPTKEAKGRGWMAGEEEKVGDKPPSVLRLRHLLQRLWGIFRTERRELSSGIRKACFPRAFVQTGRMCKLPCPSCSYSGNLAKNLRARQSHAGLRSPPRLLPALEAARSGCQAHIAVPRLIWIYRSTERHAARGEDLGPEEGFSLVEQINKWPLPLLSVSKLEGEEEKMKLLSWHRC